MDDKISDGLKRFTPEEMKELQKKSIQAYQFFNELVEYLSSLPPDKADTAYEELCCLLPINYMPLKDYMKIKS